MEVIFLLDVPLKPNDYYSIFSLMRKLLLYITIDGVSYEFIYECKLVLGMLMIGI